MKKRLLLAALLGVLALGCVACGKGASDSKDSQGGVSVESTTSEGTSESTGTSEGGVIDPSHVHKMTKIRALEATCTYAGNIECWVCNSCKNYYLDEAGTEMISRDEIKLPQLPHEGTYNAAKEATCDENGHIEHYSCSMCKKYYEDEACTVVLDKSVVFLPSLPHNISYQGANYGIGNETGVAAHWHCDACNNYYEDEAGTKELEEADLILAAPYSIPDFIVEVPANKTPVVLQLSDTQIIDAGQTRPGRDGVYYDWWATDKVEERCYDYITETINATNPDFIIITGDVIYGEFDDNGSALVSFINFMESFQIPWSPVFGNHDNESKMGVDWQCEQFEKAPYCYFEQKTLSGNGNYSVGIAQNGVVTRAFYLLDSNGCGNASAESLANGHTYNSFVGFRQDQIDWYTNQITELHKASPDTKISFAYHIQQNIFGQAYQKYGFNQAEKYQDINIDWIDDAAETDFGYIGRQMKGPWDTNGAVYKGMKALGTDSIFVGHEHCNSASVVYDGVRFQFGQKSSEYDRFNSIAKDGTITGDYQVAAGSVSMIGGTVIPLTADGTIEAPYIYLCGDEADKRNQKPEAAPVVGGIQKGTDLYGDGAMTLEAVKFDANTNAYAATANSQGKVYINTALLSGKTTFTFTVYVPSGSNCLAGQGPFSLRIKPDDGRTDNIPGALNDGGKHYISFEVGDKAAADEVRLQVDTWQTFTVDITEITNKANPCTEFSFLIAAGNTIYFRDLALS